MNSEMENGVFIVEKSLSKKEDRGDKSKDNPNLDVVSQLKSENDTSLSECLLQRKNGMTYRKGIEPNSSVDNSNGRKSLMPENDSKEKNDVKLDDETDNSSGVTHTRYTTSTNRASRNRESFADSSVNKAFDELYDNLMAESDGMENELLDTFERESNPLEIKKEKTSPSSSYANDGSDERNMAIGCGKTSLSDEYEYQKFEYDSSSSGPSIDEVLNEVPIVKVGYPKYGPGYVRNKYGQFAPQKSGADKEYAKRDSSSLDSLFNDDDADAKANGKNNLGEDFDESGIESGRRSSDSTDAQLDGIFEPRNSEREKDSGDDFSLLGESGIESGGRSLDSLEKFVGRNCGIRNNGGKKNLIESGEDFSLLGESGMESAGRSSDALEVNICGNPGIRNNIEGKKYSREKGGNNTGDDFPLLDESGMESEARFLDSEGAHIVANSGTLSSEGDQNSKEYGKNDFLEISPDNNLEVKINQELPEKVRVYNLAEAEKIAKSDFADVQISRPKIPEKPIRTKKSNIEGKFLKNIDPEIVKYFRDDATSDNSVADLDEQALDFELQECKPLIPKIEISDFDDVSEKNRESASKVKFISISEPEAPEDFFKIEKLDAIPEETCAIIDFSTVQVGLNEESCAALRSIGSKSDTKIPYRSGEYQSFRSPDDAVSKSEGLTKDSGNEDRYAYRNEAFEFFGLSEDDININLDGIIGMDDTSSLRSLAAQPTLNGELASLGGNTLVLDIDENDAEKTGTTMENQDDNLKGFSRLYFLAQIVGLLMIVASIAWIIGFQGGYGWNDLYQRFYWHPFLMTVGFLYCTGNALLIYRAFRESHKRTLKCWHMSLHIVTLVLALAAAYAVFSYHILSEPPLPNFYNLHSWMGGLTVLLFLLQFVVAFVTFVSPNQVSVTTKATMMTYHTYYGHFVFILASATACVGLNERAKSDSWSGASVMAIVYGLLIVLFAGMVVYLTSRQRYRRTPRSEDGMLLNTS